MKQPTDPTSTPPVHCSHAGLVDLADLRPHPRNPNRHNDQQIALLAKNIRALGWRHPVLVSKLSGFVVAGHARIEAARLLNLAAVPVDFQPFDCESDELAYLVADNRIAELAERDNATIKDLLEVLDDGQFDTDLTGYCQQEIERLMNQTMPESKVKLADDPECVISFPARIWLQNRAEIVKAAESALKEYAGVFQWPQ